MPQDTTCVICRSLFDYKEDEFFGAHSPYGICCECYMPAMDEISAQLGLIAHDAVESFVMVVKLLSSSEIEKKA